MQDCFVVIASDGVWGPVSDGEARHMVSKLARPVTTKHLETWCENSPQAVRIVAGALREGGEARVGTNTKIRAFRCVFRVVLQKSEVDSTSLGAGGQSGTTASGDRAPKGWPRCHGLCRVLAIGIIVALQLLDC